MNVLKSPPPPARPASGSFGEWLVEAGLGKSRHSRVRKRTKWCNIRAPSLVLRTERRSSRAHGSLRTSGVRCIGGRRCRLRLEGQVGCWVGWCLSMMGRGRSRGRSRDRSRGRWDHSPNGLFSNWAGRLDPNGLSLVGSRPRSQRGPCLRTGSLFSVLRFREGGRKRPWWRG